MENRIKLLILDVDGIMTNGTKTYDQSGLGITKNFCDKDWTAIKRFKAVGVEVIFLTGDPFNLGIAKRRQVDCIVNRDSDYHKCKSTYLPEILEKYQVTVDEIAYFGDDLFDIGIIRCVKYNYCPEDAPNMVKDYCDIINGKGGENLVAILFDYLEQEGYIQKVSYEKVIGLINELDKKQVF